MEMGSGNYFAGGNKNKNVQSHNIYRSPSGELNDFKIKNVQLKVDGDALEQMVVSAESIESKLKLNSKTFYKFNQFISKRLTLNTSLRFSLCLL